MNQQPKSLDELFSEEEETALTRTRAEIAAEDAAWRALPQAERDRITEERRAIYDAMFDIPETDDEDEDDDSDEEE